MADAKVTVVNSTTSESRVTATNASGGYDVSHLAPGEYTLSIIKTGFQTFLTTNLTISIDSVARINAELQIGNVTEQVTVSATAVGLQTDRSDMRFETNQRALQDLPTPFDRG